MITIFNVFINEVELHKKESKFMKFEILKKDNLKRNIIIGGCVVLIISAVILNFSSARYRSTASVPIVNSTINYSRPDLEIIALYINGVVADELDSSKNYTLDTIKSTCTYKDRTKIDNLTLSYDSDTKAFSIAPYTTRGTKCTLYFEETKGASGTIEDLYQTNPTMLAYDDANNLRYIGANPNNYVTFNGELWRIIGVFNADSHGVSGQKLVKIIRNESIGNYAWDNKASGTGTSTSQYGSNDWSDSAIQVVLNSGAYWNRTRGTCPSEENESRTSCNFSTTGLTAAAKEMIATVTWKLVGTLSYTNATANNWYRYERGTTVYSGHATTWSGKVGLMYPSDYGYATSGGSTTNRSTCLSTALYRWNNSSYNDCKNNDWLYNSSILQWTLTPLSSYSDPVFGVSNIGSVISGIANNEIGVRPSVYLTSEVTISGGEGTQSSPYTLS